MSLLEGNSIATYDIVNSVTYFNTGTKTTNISSMYLLVCIEVIKDQYLSQRTHVDWLANFHLISVSETFKAPNSLPTDE